MACLSAATTRRVTPASRGPWPRWPGSSPRSRPTTRTAMDRAIRIILLLHGMILSFGGIPLLYYGDELGTLNDSFLPGRPGQGRRQPLDAPARASTGIGLSDAISAGAWSSGSSTACKQMIAVRKTIPAFADFNNRELIDTSKPAPVRVLAHRPGVRQRRHPRGGEFRRRSPAPGPARTGKPRDVPARRWRGPIERRGSRPSG